MAQKWPTFVQYVFLLFSYDSSYDFPMIFIINRLIAINEPFSGKQGCFPINRVVFQWIRDPTKQE